MRERICLDTADRAVPTMRHSIYGLGINPRYAIIESQDSPRRMRANIGHDEPWVAHEGLENAFWQWSPFRSSSVNPTVRRVAHRHTEGNTSL
jgi:hypothetical protein